MEHDKYSSDEVSLAKRSRRAVQVGNIDWEELQALEISKDLMQEIREFVSEHVCVHGCFYVCLCYVCLCYVLCVHMPMWFL